MSEGILKVEKFIYFEYLNSVTSVEFNKIVYIEHKNNVVSIKHWNNVVCLPKSKLGTLIFETILKNANG